MASVVCCVLTGMGDMILAMVSSCFTLVGTLHKIIFWIFIWEWHAATRESMIKGCEAVTVAPSRVVKDTNKTKVLQLGGEEENSSAEACKKSNRFHANSKAATYQCEE